VLPGGFQLREGSLLEESARRILSDHRRHRCVRVGATKATVRLRLEDDKRLRYRVQHAEEVPVRLSDRRARAVLEPREEVDEDSARGHRGD
jgi:hypothetical protein